MSVIEEGKCRIEFLNNKGLGVGFTDLGQVTLPYTLVGELVTFERHTYRGKANCILKEIIEPSQTRQTPECKYFTSCGGCLLQHLSIVDYNNFKHNVGLDALLSQGIHTIINPIITIPPSNRRRANLEVIKKNDQVFLGFHRFHSHQIININECPALLPQLSHLIIPLKEVFNQILEHKQKAQLFITNCHNGIDITITIQEQSCLRTEQRKILLEFAKHYKITRLLFRYRKSLDIIQELERPYVLFGNIAVEVDAYSFLQSSSLSDEILQDLIFKYLDCQGQNVIARNEVTKQSQKILDSTSRDCHVASVPSNDNSVNPQSIVDLFCGRGTYTIPLSNYFKVDGFESDQMSIDAIKRAILNTDRQITLEKRDLFNFPLTALELNKYNFCTINPPRAGASSQCQELANSDIDKIIYISCNPESFASDAKILTDNSYILVEVTLLDQFYWSPHIELVGFFRKNKA